jgi:hypothetical protein
MFCTTNPSFETARKIKTLKQKEIKTTPLPIIPTSVLERDFLPSPLIKKPIKGRRGTR